MTRDEIRAAGAKAAEGAPPLKPEQRALIRATFAARPVCHPASRRAAA